MSKNGLFLAVVCIAALFLVGCMAGPNTVVDVPSASGGVIGFWGGLWDGMICPFAWFCSLFTDSINIYEVHNNGGWYNFGFVLGAGILFGGGSSAASSAKSK